MKDELTAFFLTHQKITLVMVFIFGCVIGSFLNVCIYRIPRGETVIGTPSHCTNCGHPISWYDNIPLLSYMLLRAKCRYCKGRISLRYPTVEGTSAILYVLIFLRFDISLESLTYSIFASLLLVCAFTDLERGKDGKLYLLIPDKVTVPGGIVGIALSSVLPSITLVDALSGVVVGGGLLYLVMRITPRGMGEGDTKLSAMMGAFLGWKKVLVAVYFGVIIGAVVGLILIALKIKGRRDVIPFGPFLVIGALLTIFFGDFLISRYLSSILKPP